jgi:hypothetical protein
VNRGEQAAAEPAAATAAEPPGPAAEHPAAAAGAAEHRRAGRGRQRRNPWPMTERSDDLPAGARLVAMLDMMGGSSPSS